MRIARRNSRPIIVAALVIAGVVLVTAVAAAHDAATRQATVSATAPAAAPLTTTGNLRAGTLALSPTTNGRLRLVVIAVDGSGRPAASTLRVSAGPGRTPGSGAVASYSSAVVHRVLLPAAGVAGAMQYYDIVIGNRSGTVHFPASGRYAYRVPPAPSQPLQIAIWGDSRPNTLAPGAAQPPAFAAIVTAILQRQPRPTLALAGGDLVNVVWGDTAAGLDQKYESMLAVADRLGRRLPVAFAAGNHEDLAAPNALAAWRRWLGLPFASDPLQRYYSFTTGDVRVIVLADSGVDGDGTIGYVAPDSPANSTQAKWLVQELKDNTSRWTVVLLHHPIFDHKTTDPWASSPEHDALAQLFADYGVDVVVQGHVHNYRRHEQPVPGSALTMTYLTQGGGGAPKYPVSDVPVDAQDVAAYSAYGYTILSSDGAGSLTGTSYKVDPSTGATTVGDHWTVEQIPRK
jgi:hypothetical protein